MRELKGFVLGVLVCAIVLGGIVFAASTTKMIEVTYGGIKMTYDGEEIVPKDGLGNPVEPFAYNGSTYLPVRAVAQAFGKEVAWDSKTNTVVFTTPKEEMKGTDLTTLDFQNYKESDKENAVTFIKNGGYAIDWNKKQYKTGLVLKFGNIFFNTFPLFQDSEVNISIDVPLDGKYRRLTGQAFLPKKMELVDWKNIEDYKSDDGIDVYIYGDGKLLKKLEKVITLQPADIDVDVTGVKKLTFGVTCKDTYYFVLGNLFVEE